MLEILAIIVVSVLAVVIFSIMVDGMAPTKFVSLVLMGVFFVLVIKNL